MAKRKRKIWSRPAIWRKFGDMWYALYDSYPTKQQALKHANWARKRGYYVRIVKQKSTGRWLVYEHWKQIPKNFVPETVKLKRRGRYIQSY